MMRDTASVPPPGGAGTIQRIGREGNASCAKTDNGATQDNANNALSMIVTRFIEASSPVFTSILGAL